MSNNVQIDAARGSNKQLSNCTIKLSEWNEFSEKSLERTSDLDRNQSSEDNDGLTGELKRLDELGDLLQRDLTLSSMDFMENSSTEEKYFISKISPRKIERNEIIANFNSSLLCDSKSLDGDNYRNYRTSKHPDDNDEQKKLSESSSNIGESTFEGFISRDRHPKEKNGTKKDRADQRENEIPKKIPTSTMVDKHSRNKSEHKSDRRLSDLRRSLNLKAASVTEALGIVQSALKIDDTKNIEHKCESQCESPKVKNGTKKDRADQRENEIPKKISTSTRVDKYSRNKSEYKNDRRLPYLRRSTNLKAASATEALGTVQSALKIDDTKNIEHKCESQCEINLNDELRVLREAKKSLGCSIYRVSESFHKIGDIRFQEGDYVSAIKHYKKSLRLKDGISIEEMNTLTNMGTSYFHLRMYDKAIQCFQECLSVIELRPSESNDLYLKVATLLNKMGNVYAKKKLYAEARKSYSRALKIKLQLIGDENHLDILSIRHNICLILFKEGRFNEALDNFHEIYERKISILGENHPESAKLMIDMGSLCLQMGEYNDARKMSESAWEVFNNISLPKHHPYWGQLKFIVRKVRKATRP